MSIQETETVIMVVKEALKGDLDQRTRLNLESALERLEQILEEMVFMNDQEMYLDTIEIA